MEDFYRLLLGALAVWRATHLFQAEDGPWDIVARLRRVSGNSFWGKLLDCFHCLSIWIAAPAACLLARGWKEMLFLWFALSGGAILLERLTPQSVMYYEDKENEHVVLRESENTITGDQTPVV